MAVEVIGLERTPRKPGLTFLLIPALVLWAAAAATFGLSETLPPAAVPVCAVICLVLGLISALLVIPSSKKDLMLALALGFLGCLSWGAVRTAGFNGFQFRVHHPLRCPH